MNMATHNKIYKTGYDRSACRVGVAHIGYGAFHRAHQAVYFDDYMEITGDLNWGIAAVNLRPSESPAFKEAQKANAGYLLKTTSPDGARQLRLVRPHIEYIDWATETNTAEALLSRPGVDVVTITVTESGYYLDDGGALNTHDPVIKSEIEGSAAGSVYAYLARALEQRSKELNHPISILCCDNIRANGHMLERNFLTYLELTQRAGLAAWVRKNATFPCSMVDRITPRSTEALIREIEAEIPGAALAPIQAESFIQWVLEDRFAGPMPDLAQAGVEVVADVDPYEEAKIRILNGGHTGLCYIGALAGLNTFDEAMRNPQTRPHFDGWEANEVLPGLTIDLPFDKSAYRDEIAARFGNAAIADTLERICMDGWSKMPIYVRPTLESCLKQGISPRFGYDCIASWYVYARRFAAGTMPIAYLEPYWDSLNPLLAPGQEANFAKSRQLWAALPETYDDFVSGVVTAINEMEIKWPV